MSGKSIITQQVRTKYIAKQILRYYFPVLPPKKHSKTSRNSPISHLGRTSFERIVIPNIMEPLLFAEKGKDMKQPGKEEIEPIKMPGFVHPETAHEVGYFTQQAKKDLEELKKRATPKPNLINPEKKE